MPKPSVEWECEGMSANSSEPVENGNCGRARRARRAVSANARLTGAGSPYLPQPHESFQPTLSLFLRRVIRSQQIEDLVLEFLRIDRARAAINDLSARRDQHGVREWTRPFWIERLHQRVRARTGVEQVQRTAAFRREQPLQPARRRRVLLLEKLFYLRLQLRIIDPDRDEPELDV